MEIVLYKSGVGKYYRVIELGDISDFQDSFGAGVTQAQGGYDTAVKGSNDYNDLDIGLWLQLEYSLNSKLDVGASYLPDVGSDYSISMGAPTYAPNLLEIQALSHGVITAHVNNYGYTSGSYYERSAIWFAVATINNHEYFGFLLANGNSKGWGFLYQTVNTAALNVIWNGAETESSPGAKGFRPPSARKSKDRPGTGGEPTEPGDRPKYKGDPIDNPGAPNEDVASAIGTGFITAYKMTKANLKTLGQCLWGTTLEGFLSGLFVNPLDFIVSLCVFPCAPDVGELTPVKLGRWECSTDPTTGLLFESDGAPLTSQFKVVDFGTITIPENWGSFLDYSLTSLELYLPFIGTVEIDTSECMGGTMKVDYTIDFFTGMCVANVLCTKPNFYLPNGQLIEQAKAQHSYQGNCAIQIPLSRVDYGSMVGNLINAAALSVTNPMAGIASLGSDALGGGLKGNVSSKGNIVANSGFCSILYPYVRLKRPVTSESDSYQDIMGYPSYVNTKLGQCSDLCICEDIDLKTITGATEQELNKIRQLCKDGVYV